MTAAGKIRILIADDFKVLREVIRMHLEQAEDMEVAGEAPDIYEALELAKTLRPEVIVMNDYLPPMDSASGAELFRKEGITAAILVISMTAEPEMIRRSFQNGVNGFMHKDEIAEFMLEAIRSIRRGEYYRSPRVHQSYDRTSD